jgi:hypothetical protein
MIKRPLNAQFSTAVLEGRKVTTIRRTPWPIGVPIMLYHWEGAPYRSKHLDLAVVEVMEVTEIEIRHSRDGYVDFAGVGRGGTRHPLLLALPYPHVLWRSEGFESEAELTAWFASALGRGTTEIRYLMRFRLVDGPATFDL